MKTPSGRSTKSDKPSHRTPMTAELIRSAGLKLTPARARVLELLRKNHCLMTIDEVSRRLGSEPGVAPVDWVTVYRTLQSFEKAGLVSRTQLTDGSSRFEFELRSSGDCEENHHHHHVLCARCGKIEPLEECGISAIEKHLQDLGYSEITHRLEFSGVCGRCGKSRVR
ncbi:MAG: transcriptional repressor [Proteobacteria bacterium]|nr:transcriptional repressor [Pseudomonadota bacterium]